VKTKTPNGRGKVGDEDQEGPRYTIRLTERQGERLAALGRVERRQIPKILRKCLDVALAAWEKRRESKGVEK